MDDFVDGPELDFFDPMEQMRAEAEARRHVEDGTHEAGRLLERRALAYRRVFSGQPQDDDVDVVMLDIAKFCRGFNPTFHPDQRVHALLEGRREVFLRIMDFTRLDHDALLRKYTGA